MTESKNPQLPSRGTRAASGSRLDYPAAREAILGVLDSIARHRDRGACAASSRRLVIFR